MNLLYLDCSSGASGDMLLGALLDALDKIHGGREEEPSAALERWSALMQELLATEPGGRFELGHATRGGIRARRIEFFVGQQRADAHRGGHVHLTQLEKLFENARRSSEEADEALDVSLRALRLIGRAEAAVHGTSLERVHFHEVGAFDSVMDLAGFGFALKLLKVSQVVASPPTLGSGTVQTAHGILGVPPPAVVEILRECEMPSSDLVLPGECLTPTGAALLAESVHRWGAVPPMHRILAQGLGAGSREVPGKPNVLRCIVGTAG